MENSMSSVWKDRARTRVFINGEDFGEDFEAKLAISWACFPWVGGWGPCNASRTAGTLLALSGLS